MQTLGWWCGRTKGLKLVFTFFANMYIFKAGGENIPVTRENILEYIYLFVEQRLLGQHVKCLEAIRRGVFDVIPPESIAHLAPEDLRLILCGIQEISISLLQSYTKVFSFHYNSHVNVIFQI